MEERKFTNKVEYEQNYNDYQFQSVKKIKKTNVPIIFNCQEI